MMLSVYCLHKCLEFSKISGLPCLKHFWYILLATENRSSIKLQPVTVIDKV